MQMEQLALGPSKCIGRRRTNMRPVQFVTDSSSDLPVELTRELDMHIIPLTYIINGEAKQDDLWVCTLSLPIFTIKCVLERVAARRK
jgi:hypothetical protein